MRLSNFGIVFAMVFTCFGIVWGVRLKYCEEKQLLTIKYNNAIDNSVSDCLIGFVEKDDSERIIYNCDEATRIFFESLAINLGQNEVEIYELYNYVPALIYILPEGIRVYHLEENENNNQTELKYCSSELFKYQYTDVSGKYKYELTLGDYVTAVSIVDGEVFTGLKNDVINYIDDGFLVCSEYELVKQNTINRLIVEQLEYYTRQHNNVLRKYDFEYEFFIPVMEDSQWVRTINQPGVIAVFQGYPFSTSIGEKFNKLAFGGARIYK